MRILRRLLISLTLLIALLLISQLFMPVPAPSDFTLGQVDNIAHQGGNLEQPDATIAAFDAAVAAGADVLEMDVHLSLDGQLMVIHDARIERTSNGQGAVRELTAQQLQTFDAAYWWPYHANDDVAKARVPADQAFPYRGQGLQIPTLAEILQRYPQQRLAIELKDNSPELRQTLAQLLDQQARWSSVMVASFYPETLQQLRADYPQAQTYAAENEIRLLYILHLLRLERLFPYLVPVDAIAIPMTSGGINLASARFIQAAQHAGLQVHYWTINDADDMRHLLRLGADGLMTDRPALLAQVRAELLGLASPARLR